MDINIKKKLLSLLGMAQKAGKLVSGEANCENYLRNEQACLVLACTDASDNTKSKFSKKTFYYKIPYFNFLTKEELNQAIGRQNRATIAIIDSNFAERIQSYLNELQNTEEQTKT